MKHITTLVVAAAFMAMPLAATAGGYYQQQAGPCAVAYAPAPAACAPVAYAQAPSPCAPNCQKSCCFNPLAPVAGVVQGIGGLFSGIANGIGGIFNCNTSCNY